MKPREKGDNFKLLVKTEKLMNIIEKSMTEYIYKHNEYTFHNFKTTIFLEN